MYCFRPVCTVCLSHTNLINLDTSDGDNIRLIDKLKICVSDNHLLKADLACICSKCSTNLNIAYSLILMCKSSKEKYDNYMLKIIKSDAHNKQSDLKVQLSDITNLDKINIVDHNNYNLNCKNKSDSDEDDVEIVNIIEKRPKIDTNLVKLEEKSDIDEPKNQCCACKNYFNSRMQFIVHFKSRIVQVNKEVILRYKCCTCVKLFKYRRMLLKHILTHSGYQTQDTNAQQNYNRIKRKSDCFKCNLCSKQFRFKLFYDDHMQSHKICDDKIQTNSQNSKLNNLSGNFTCKVCSKSFKTIRGMKIHQNVHSIHRKKLKYVKCKYCTCSFKNNTTYERHLKKKHAQTKSRQQQKVINDITTKHHLDLEECNSIFQDNQQTEILNMQNIIDNDIEQISFNVVNEIVTTVENSEKINFESQNTQKPQNSQTAENEQISDNINTETLVESERTAPNMYMVNLFDNETKEVNFEGLFASQKEKKQLVQGIPSNLTQHKMEQKKNQKQVEKNNLTQQKKEQKQKQKVEKNNLTQQKKEQKQKQKQVEKNNLTQQKKEQKQKQKQVEKNNLTQQKKEQKQKQKQVEKNNLSQQKKEQKVEKSTTEQILDTNLKIWPQIRLEQNPINTVINSYLKEVTEKNTTKQIFPTNSKILPQIRLEQNPINTVINPYLKEVTENPNKPKFLTNHQKKLPQTTTSQSQNSTLLFDNEIAHTSQNKAEINLSKNKVRGQTTDAKIQDKNLENLAQNETEQTSESNSGILLHGYRKTPKKKVVINLSKNETREQTSEYSSQDNNLENVAQNEEQSISSEYGIKLLFENQQKTPIKKVTEQWFEGEDFENMIQNEQRPTSQINYYEKKMKRTSKNTDIMDLFTVDEDDSESDEESKQMQCRFCKKYFPSTLAFVHNKSVEKTKSGEIKKTFKCCVCPKAIFYERKHFFNHMDDHDTYKKIYCCSMCPNKYVNRSAYVRHLNDHENQEYQCRICHYKFDSDDEVKFHLTTIHR